MRSFDSEVALLRYFFAIIQKVGGGGGKLEQLRNKSLTSRLTLTALSGTTSSATT